MRGERERCHLNDFDHQNIIFLFQMVLYDEGNLIWVFLFIYFLP
jgi:hypothetical protein